MNLEVKNAIAMGKLALRVVRDKAANTTLHISPGVYGITYFGKEFPRSLLPTRLTQFETALRSGRFRRNDGKILQDFVDTIRIILENDH